MYGDPDKVELKRRMDFAGTGAWQVAYGNIKVTIPGWRNRWGFCHPPLPKQEHVEKAIRKAIRMHDGDEAARQYGGVEHANAYIQALKELR